MIVCPKCKAEIDADSWYCDQCGFKLRFCSSCGKPGKGNRCTYCGSMMYSRDEKMQMTSAADISNTIIDMATTGRIKGYAVPRLLLKNDTLNICLEGTNGAIIGRRNGPYQSTMSRFSYVSGTHARLDYDARSGWTVTDLNSTNGTVLNKEKLMPGVPSALPDGGMLTIANIELNIEVRP